METDIIVMGEGKLIFVNKQNKSHFGVPFSISLFILALSFSFNLWASSLCLSTASPLSFQHKKPMIGQFLVYKTAATTTMKIIKK